MLLDHFLDLATTGVEVADDGTEVVLGGGHLNGHQRLEQTRARLASGLLEGHRTGDLEGHLGGIDLVVGAVEQGDLDILDRVAGENTELHRLLDTGVDRRDVLLGDATTGDGVDELVAEARLLGLDRDDDAGELTRTTGLLLVRVLVLLDRLAQGLAVGHLRLADIGLHMELTLHAVDEDVQVKLAHTGDDGLAGLLVGVDAEGRILLDETLNGVRQLLLIGLRLRLDGLLDHGSREGHRLKDDRVARVAESLTSGGVLEAHDGADHASTDALDLLTLVGVHLVDLADALLLALGAVEHLVASVHDAGVDAHEGQLAQVRVRGNLEGQDRQRLVVGGMTLQFDGLVTRLEAGDGRDVERGRQVVDDGVEQRLHTLVFERGATGDCSEGGSQHTATNGGLELVDGHRVRILEVELHELLVVLGDGLEHLGTSGLRLVLHVGRDLLGLIMSPELSLATPGLGVHLDEVNDAHELVLGTDRQLQQNRDGVQTILDGLHTVIEGSTGAVKLVDVADARNAVLGGLTPHSH